VRRVTRLACGSISRTIDTPCAMVFAVQAEQTRSPPRADDPDFRLRSGAE
jgi:hypothetical protein